MKTLKQSLSILLCLLSLSGYSQFYGQFMHTSPNHFVSSGDKTSINNTGFITGLYEPVSAVESYNFIINKSDDNGLLSGTGTFSKGYYTLGDGTCSGTNWSQILDCNGVTAMEINPVQVGSNGTAWYAVAGSNSVGVFFALLAQDGTPLLSKQYIHPSGTTWFGKPLLIESQNIANHFYICGKGGNEMYAMLIDAGGNVVWTNSYDCNSGNANMYPQQIIECPYSGDLVVVGLSTLYTYNPIRATDGFFLKLSSSNGAVNVFNLYGHPIGACNEFYSINVAQSTKGGSDGFVIGGWSDPYLGALGRSWVLKVDPNGNQIWNWLLNPNAGTANLKGIFERLNTLGEHEYYAVGLSFAGYTVLKMDDNGAPYPGGNNEFWYDAPLTNWSDPVSMTHITSTGPSLNEGIHIFGDAQISAPGNSFQVAAYFNGVSGCQSNLLNNMSFAPGPNSVVTPPIGVSKGPYRCPSFTLMSFNLNTPTTYICSANSVAGGSNARWANLSNEETGTYKPTDPTTIAHDLNPNMAPNKPQRLFGQLGTLSANMPNPFLSKTLFKVTIPQGSKEADLRVYSIDGKLIKTVPVTDTAGDTTIELDGTDMKAGVYFCTLYVDGMKQAWRQVVKQ